MTALEAAKVGGVDIVGRLIAPNYSIGNAFADLQTIPLEARRAYINTQATEPLFDTVRFLADYERRRPGAFPIRDELVTFKQAPNGQYRARITGNRYPGVYRIAAFAVGSVDFGAADSRCCHPAPQSFGRVLNAEIALGLLPDKQRSAGRIEWRPPNTLAIAITPADKLGNIAAPSEFTPVVQINGVGVVSKHINDYSGEHRLEVQFRGERIEVTPDRVLKGGRAVVQTLDGKELELAPNKKISVAIQAGSTLIDI